MFTLHNETDDNATFHFDADGETPRRWHVGKRWDGKWDFVTDMCHTKNRKPGIPVALKGMLFDTKEDAIAAVLAMN